MDKDQDTMKVGCSSLPCCPRQFLMVVDKRKQCQRGATLRKKGYLRHNVTGERRPFRKRKKTKTNSQNLQNHLIKKEKKHRLGRKKNGNVRRERILTVDPTGWGWHGGVGKETAMRMKMWKKVAVVAAVHQTLGEGCYGFFFRQLHFQ